MKRFFLSLFVWFFSVLILFTPVLLEAQDAGASGNGAGGAAGAAGAAAPVTETAGAAGLAEPTGPAAAAPVLPAVETAPAESKPTDHTPAAETGEAEIANPLSEIAGDIKREIPATETLGSYLRRLGIALGIIAAQALIIWIFWHYLFRFITLKAVNYFGGRIKPLTIKKLRLLSTKQILNLIVFGVKILKYICTVFQLVFTVPLLFALFPRTRDLAFTLFGYILTPFKNIVFGAIAYIPNLITIAVILFFTRYILRGLKFFAVQIEKEKLVIPGFYADWANPTFNILRVLLYAFTVAIIYPYLPGSESRIFQGVSVLVGVIFSLGSSTAIGNLVAGLV
ncbi:MAG: mechanosensitive ion channel family protein, partial [Treponema sp.]|nr:mechanosensitive ion channel family protein [Treponema sp.]